MEIIMNIEWDFYKVSALIAAFGALTLGLISMIKGPGNKLNITISFFNFIVMIWIVLLFLLRVIKSLETANSMVRFFGAAMFLLPVVFLRFSIIFTKTEIKWVKILYNCLLLSALVLIVLSMLKIGTKSLYYKTEGGYFIAQPDLVYSIFNYNLIAGIVTGMYLLIKKYVSSVIQSIEKKQTQYLLMAFIILALFGITNQLDIFGIKIAPMAVFGAFFYILIMTYAALTYDLLQVKEMLANLLTFILVAAGFSVLAVALLLLMNSISDFNTQVLVGLPAGAFIILAVNWLGKTANKLSGRIFLHTMDLDFVLNLMHEKTKSGARASEVAAQINSIVSGTLQIDKLFFTIRHGAETNFTDEQNRLNLPGNSPMIKLLDKNRTILYFEELNNRLHYSGGSNAQKKEIKEILDFFTAAGAELCMPVIIGNSIRGIWFIGAKKSKNIFSREEMRFLHNTLNLFAMRLENIMLYEQLMGAERLSMLGQLAAGVAHEIRNPLTGLSGFIQMINEGKEKRGKIIDRFFQIAPGEFKRLEKLTENLLALGHTTNLTLSAENVNDLLVEEVEFMSYILKKKKIGVEIQKGDVPSVKIDKDQVQQVVLNLILNAVQAMPDGGKIELITGGQIRGERNYIFISVKDSGTGMDPEIVDRIFDPFFTTKADGSGLGLAISRNIMQAHGGFIEFETVVKSGSRFCIFFPAGR